MIDPERALDQYLDQVLSGEIAIDDLRRAHPELGEEVLSLLESAERVWRSRYRGPDADELEHGRRRLLAELAAGDPTPESRWRRFVASLQPAVLVRGVVVALIALVLTGGGVTAAATQSEPGSVLYAYRLALEETRVNLAAEDDRADIYLDLADQRLAQLSRAAAIRAPDRVATAGDAYAQALELGVSALRRSGRTVPAGRLRNLARRYRETLAAHAAILEATAVETVAQADAVIFDLAANARESVAMVDEIPAAAVPTVTPAPAAPVAVGPEPSPVATARAATPSIAAATVAPTARPERPATGPPREPARTVQIRGQVTDLADASLGVDGQRVILPAGRVQIDGELAVGALVRVAALRQPDGTLVARRIGVERPPAAAAVPTVGPAPAPTPHPSAEVQRFSAGGVILSIDGTRWTVGDTVIIVDHELVPELRVLGDPAIGRRVRVAGRLGAAGARLAVRVIVVPAVHGGGDRPPADEPPVAERPVRRFELRGVVQALEPPWLTVDGERILVSREQAPRLQVRGDPAVGSLVTVIGIERPDGTRLALRLVFEPSERPARPSPRQVVPTPSPDAPTRRSEAAPSTFRLRGVVRVLDPPWLIVGDTSVLVSVERVPDLRVSGRLSVGATVTVEGRVLEDGTRLAQVVVATVPPQTRRTAEPPANEVLRRARDQGRDDPAPTVRARQRPPVRDSRAP